MSGDQAGDEAFTARFEAARQACLTGHDAGCTYGGLTPEGGYWLAVEGCPLDHGDACATCGGEPEARFGDWEAAGLSLLVWGVWLCAACRDRELALNAGKWRAPQDQEDREDDGLEGAVRASVLDRAAEAFGTSREAGAPPEPVQFEGLLAALGHPGEPPAETPQDGVRKLAEEILRQEQGIADGSLTAAGGYLFPRRVPCAEPAPEMLADPSFGACCRMRPDVACVTLGRWKPFYQSYVCTACLEADTADVGAGGAQWPFRRGGGPGLPDGHPGAAGDAP